MQTFSGIDEVEFSTKYERLFFTLKRPFKFSLAFSYFLVIVSYLQILLLMMAIPLKDFNSVPTDTTVIDIVRYIGPLELRPGTKSLKKQEIGLIVIGVYEIIQLCLFGVLIYLVAFKKTNPNKTFSLILRAMLLLNFYVLFFPMHSYLTQSINFAADGYIDIYVLEKNIFVIIAWVLLIVNVIFSFVGSVAYSKIRNKDFFAKKNSSICSLTFLYKLVITILVETVGRQVSVKWIVVGFSVLYLILVYYFFMQRLIFFNLRMVKLFALILGNLLAVVLVMFALAIWDEVEDISIQVTFFVFWIIMLPYTTIKTKGMMQNILYSAARVKNSQLNSEGSYFKKLIGLKWIFMEGCKNHWKSTKKAKTHAQLLFFAVLNEHIEQCTLEECQCSKVFIANNDPDYPGELSVNKTMLNDVMHTIICETIKSSAMKMKNKSNILLDMAYFFLVKDDKFLTAYNTLRQMHGKKTKRRQVLTKSPSMRYLEKMIESIIRSKCGKEDGKTEKLKVRELIRHQELREDLKELMALQTEKQLELWNALQTTNWETMALFKKAREIELTRTQIDKIWVQVSSRDHNDLVVYMLYGLYSSIINNNFMKSEKLMKKIDIMSTLAVNNNEVSLTNDTIYDAANVLVSMSMDRETIGKVQSITRNSKEIFGYEQQEVVGSNVAILMPNFLRKRHQGFLVHYLTSRKTTLFNSQRRTFGKSKKGHIFPINIYVSVYPSLENGLAYFGIVRPIKEFKQYILLTNNGYVDSCTEDVLQELSITTTGKSRLHIAELCHELGKINAAFNFLALQKQKSTQTQKTKTAPGTKKTRGETEDDFDEDIYDVGAITKGDSVPLFDKNIGTRNFITDNYQETMGMETTFRMNTKDNTLPPMMNHTTTNGPSFINKLLGSDEQYSKAVYEKFVTQGEILEFHNRKDHNTSVFYHCLIQDEVYGSSTLRILTLSQAGRAIKDSSGMFAEDKPLFGGVTLNEPPSKIDESSFAENMLIPEERSDVIGYAASGRSGRSVENVMNQITPYDGASVTSRFNYNGASVTSRFNNEPLLNPNKNPSFLVDISQIERNKDSTNQNFLMSNSSMRQNNPRQGSMLFNLVSRGQTLDKNQFVPSTNNEDFGVSHDYNSRTFSAQKTTPFPPPGNVTSGSHKASKSPDMIDTDPLKKFLKQHRTHIKKDFERSSNAGTSSSASSNRIFGQVEKAFGEWKKIDKYFSWLLVGISIGIAAFAILVAYFVIVRKELSGIAEDSLTLFHVGNRINNYLEVNRNIVILDLYVKGHLDTARHVADGIPDYVEYVRGRLEDDVNSLNSENGQLMAYVDDLSSELQDQLYADRNVITVSGETDPTLSQVTLNTFTAVYKIISYAAEIMITPAASLSTKETVFTNFLDNALGDLMTNLEKPYDIYSGKITHEFNVIESYFIAAIAIVTGGFFLFFVKSYFELHQLTRETNKFWEALIRFDLVKSDEHRTELKILMNGFKQDLGFNELFSEVTKLKEGESTPMIFSSVPSKSDKSKDKFGFMKKSHDWRHSRIYLPTYIPIVFMFVVLIATICISKIFLTIQENREDNFLEQLKIIYDTFQLESFATTLLYQYIRTGGTAVVQDRPIEDVLLEKIQSMANVNSIIAQFRAQDNEETASLVEADLCRSLFADMNQTLCYSVGNGANAKGLTAVLSFMAESIDFVKDYYDKHSSSATVIADTMNLDQLIQIETEFEFLTDGFEQVGWNIEVSQDEEQSNFIRAYVGIIIGILICEVIVLVWLFDVAYWKLRIHKENHALVLKNIPIGLIWENKLIRGYIFNLFRGSVQSVKYG